MKKKVPFLVAFHFFRKENAASLHDFTAGNISLSSKLAETLHNYFDE